MMLLCGWRKRNNKRSKSTNRKQSNASTECAINDNGSTVMSSADANPAAAMVNSSDNSTENYSKSTFAFVPLLVLYTLSILALRCVFLFSFYSLKREMEKKFEFDIQFGATFPIRCQSYFNLIWVVHHKRAISTSLITSVHLIKYKLWHLFFSISHTHLCGFAGKESKLNYFMSIRDLACKNPRSAFFTSINCASIAMNGFCSE